MKRPLFKLLGYACIGLGAIGALLPLMPTVPFLILATFCFARSDPLLEAKMLQHPRFGPHIRAWREHGAIPLFAKRTASALMLVSVLSSYFILPNPWSFLPGLIVFPILIWVWTRPSV